MPPVWHGELPDLRHLLVASRPSTGRRRISATTDSQVLGVLAHLPDTPKEFLIQSGHGLIRFYSGNVLS